MSNISVICGEYVDLICKDLMCDGHTKKKIREAIEKTISFVAIHKETHAKIEFPVDGDVDQFITDGYDVFPIIEPDCITEIDYEHGDS